MVTATSDYTPIHANRQPVTYIRPPLSRDDVSPAKAESPVHHLTWVTPAVDAEPRTPWKDLKDGYRWHLRQKGWTRQRWDGMLSVHRGPNPEDIKPGYRFGSRTVRSVDPGNDRITLVCDCGNVNELSLWYVLNKLPVTCGAHDWQVNESA